MPLVTKPAERCDEIIARTPEVILERGPGGSDYTHLQRCNRPVLRDGKCARHATAPNRGLLDRWRRFYRRSKQ